ncbi:MAG: D-alanyl-D-alanine carboxypeptidase [Victivallaceae bacterium]|nr:D-alanyl-D-alanine carboxypeptidase [Victivallaceae bacterium]
MNEISRSRFKFFAIVLIVILGLHAAVIGFFVLRHRPSAEASGANPPEAVEVVEAGGAAAPGGAAAVAPVKPATVYRDLEADPNAGKPFIFAGTLRKLPGKVTMNGKLSPRSGIIVDTATRHVLWAKDEHKRVPVASMVKMMTMLLTMEKLESNPAIGFDSDVPITRAAMSVPRTGVAFLVPGEKFTVREMLSLLAVKSANDAATQMGEFVGGSVSNFVAMMNERAVQLGLKDSVFVSPCGLRDKTRGNSLSSAHDMAMLGEQLLKYPDIMHMCVLRTFSIREGAKKSTFNNTNKLITSEICPGIDGLKTGFTNDAGFCITFSANRKGRRIVGCVTGFKSRRDRDNFCRFLINWAYESVK